MKSLKKLSSSFLDLPPSSTSHVPTPRTSSYPTTMYPPTASSQSAHPFHVRRMEIKDPEYMSEVPEHLQNKHIPGFPTTVVAVGEPGSGKTNCLMNLLTREDMWKGFYDRIYYLGPTIKSDKLYQHLNIPKDQIVTEQEEFIPKLVEWTTRQVEEVERDAAKAPKCLFIFEDITSYYHTAQSSPDFAKCFNTIRHHKASAYANIHKLKALNRTARMACRHVMVWPVNKSEIMQLYDDYGPKNLSKWDFMVLCKHAWTPDPQNEKPFLYINKYADESERFRRCFTHIFDLTKYEGVGKPSRGKKERKETNTQRGGEGETSQKALPYIYGPSRQATPRVQKRNHHVPGYKPEIDRFLNKD